MKLRRWMSAIAIAGVLSVPDEAEAQFCSGSRFATCATVVVAPVALGAVLFSLQEPTRPGRDLGFTPVEDRSPNANDGCPSPNGDNGAESVLRHNPHCSDGGLPDVGASVAPEPTSMVLLGTALLTLGAGFRARRKSA
jgi:hypothetical protein